MVSRNAPVAFIVGVAGFIGSHVAERIIDKNVQVIGVDNFSRGSRRNISSISKNNKFHLINEDLSNERAVGENNVHDLNLPRLDYAVFALSPESISEGEYLRALHNFLTIIHNIQEKRQKHTPTPKIVLISSINLYDNKLNATDKTLKEGEILFAKFAKAKKVNARIIRLASIFGPRMHFDNHDPMTKVIQASLKGELQNQPISMDFTTRALYIDDAVNLIIKSALSGATAQKIYDGIHLPPVKVAEVKQILLDPIWHEMKEYQPSELPPWLTPNCERTIRELSWRPHTPLVKALKHTIAYFKDNEVEVPEVKKDEFKKEAKRWSFSNYYSEEELSANEKGADKQITKDKDEKLATGGVSGRWTSRILVLISLLIVGYGIIWPMISISYGFYAMKSQINQSVEYLKVGNFDRAQTEINSAKSTVDEVEKLILPLIVLKRMGIGGEQIGVIEQTLGMFQDGVGGIKDGIEGVHSLYQASSVLSGENTSNPQDYYSSAQTKLDYADQKISRLSAKLEDPEVISTLPEFVRTRTIPVLNELASSQEMVEKAHSSAYLLPYITGVNGKKEYLILLTGNTQLRPGGGMVDNFAKLTFEGGRLTGVKVQSTLNSESSLIDSPSDLKTDIGLPGLDLRNALTEVDFPTSARQAEIIYRRNSGEIVNGVIALDYQAVSQLLNAVDGVSLQDGQDQINGNNFIEKVLLKDKDSSVAEVANYTNAIYEQMFSKMFYLSDPDWYKIVDALEESLQTKHMMIYISEPKVFSFLSKENWAGILTRGKKEKEGEINDFLSLVDSNIGNNNVNLFINRKVELTTSISDKGLINESLKMTYQNVSSSTTNLVPAGGLVYKYRVKVYLPLGAKLLSAVLAGDDITKNFVTYADYNRTVYSTIIEVQPGEIKDLQLDYQLADYLIFADNKAMYRLDIVKQPGSLNDLISWTLKYPSNYTPVSYSSSAAAGDQSVITSTTISTDKSFIVEFHMAK